MDKRYDITLWGATGYSGRPAAKHLLRHFGGPGGLRIALAARSRDKLEALRQELGRPDIDIVVCAGNDPEAADALAKASRVICSAVGPAAKLSTPMVDACIRHGTDYCDLSGELHWLRTMIDTRDAKARDNGVLILNATGVDSIPSEFGVSLLQDTAFARHGEYCREIKGFFATGRISVAGGSFQSGKGVMEAIIDDPAMKDIIANPYSLNPRDALAGNPPAPDLEQVIWDADMQQWIKPFPVGQINARVVRRAHAVKGFPWGRDFVYTENALAGRGMLSRLAATAETAAVALFVNTNPRSALGKLLMALGPKEGDGPSDDRMDRNGPFSFVYHGRTPGGKTLLVEAKSPLDVHRATAALMVETAVFLATRRQDVLESGGFQTPGTAIGRALLPALQQRDVLDVAVIQ